MIQIWTINPCCNLAYGLLRKTPQVTASVACGGMTETARNGSAMVGSTPRRWWIGGRPGRLMVRGL
jgi:hypothetical protein